MCDKNFWICYINPAVNGTFQTADNKQKFGNVNNITSLLDQLRAVVWVHSILPQVAVEYATAS